MKKRLIDIVPLDALRVFEVTARLMSFSAAARELYVTQAAISRRIKQLEEILEFDLYQRTGRKLTLTPKGERLFLRVQTSLNYLGNELDILSAATTGKGVSIAAAAAVSHLWLGQRLQEFHNAYPDIPVSLTTTNNLSDLAASENGIVVVYSKGEHPEWSLSFLMPEALVPVASPQYLERMGWNSDPTLLTPRDLFDYDLFDYSRSSVRSLTFQNWFEKTVSENVDWTPTITFPTYMMAIDAALGGEGIVLGCRGLVGPHLKSGALVELTQSVLSTGYGYYLGVPKSAPIDDNAKCLANFLLKQSADNF